MPICIYMKSAKNERVLALLCLEFHCLWFLTDVCFQGSTRHHPGRMNSFLTASPSSWVPCLYSEFNEPPAPHVEPFPGNPHIFLEFLNSVRFTPKSLPNPCSPSGLSRVHLPGLLAVCLVTALSHFCLWLMTYWFRSLVLLGVTHSQTFAL